MTDPDWFVTTQTIASATVWSSRTEKENNFDAGFILPHISIYYESFKVLYAIFTKIAADGINKNSFKQAFDTGSFIDYEKEAVKRLRFLNK